MAEVRPQPHTAVWRCSAASSSWPSSCKSKAKALCAVASPVRTLEDLLIAIHCLAKVLALDECLGQGRAVVEGVGLSSWSCAAEPGQSLVPAPFLLQGQGQAYRGPGTSQGSTGPPRRSTTGPRRNGQGLYCETFVGSDFHFKSSFDSRFIPTRECTSSICGFFGPLASKQQAV